MTDRHDGAAGGPPDPWLAGALLAFAFTLPITIAVSEALAFLIVPLWWWRARCHGTPGPRPGPWGVLAAAFVVVALLASLMGLRPAHSLDKMLRFLLLGVAFLIPALAAGGRDLPGRLVGAFVAGAALKAGFDVVRIPIGAYQEWHQRLSDLALEDVSFTQALFNQGTMRDPQFYLVAVALLLAGWAAGGRALRRPATWVPLLLLAMALLLHFKRGAILGAGLALLLLALLSRRRALVGALLLGVAALAALPPMRERAAMIRDEFSVAQHGRYSLWTRAAPGLLRDHPFGVGWKALRHEDLLARTPYVQPKLNHLHNNLLQVTVETGWLGGALWLAWMTAALAGMARRWATARAAADAPGAGRALGVLCAFAGLLTVGVVEYNFGDTEIFMLLALLWGLAAADPAPARPAEV